jgi:two-component system response regulator YesN
MFSVLIVDDEEPVLDSYEFMLNAFSGNEAPRGFTLAGKARTGYEALKLIYETEPDLVFMDINIPGIDGLSVLEEVHKKYPRMVCVLSTAYERFDLAQRAIPLGVFAYLVKPVSKKVFFETLDKTLAQLESRPPEVPDQEDPKLRFLRKVIWVEMGEDVWGRYREELSLPSDKGLVLMVELEKDQEMLCSRIAGGLSYHHHCIYDVMLNRGLFLISGDINRELFVRRAEKILTEILGGVFPWYYGIGNFYRGPELYRSCSEALVDLESRKNHTDTEMRERFCISRLRHKIGVASSEELKSLFTGIWESAFAGVSVEGGYKAFMRAKAKMISLFTLLLDDITGAYGAKPEASLPFDPAEIMALEDLGAWKTWAELYFDKLVLQSNLPHSEKFPLPLVKALNFIREHYNEGIQLKDAAEHAQVSSAHLSRLFSDHLKNNFIDYITELRINEAGRLLRASKISIKEVAFAAGYQDPNYFSKSFKRITGVLPTEFREDLGRGEA